MSAQQFDSVSEPRLPAALDSAGSRITVTFAPLVSLSHGKECPQHRGTTRSRLEAPLPYSGLLLHLLSICCLAAQGKAKLSWFCLLDRLILFR